MPCDTRLRAEQTLDERQQEITAALRALEQRLLVGQVKVSIGSNGAIAFSGWAATERQDVTDVCAFRCLQAQNSWALRQAVSRAEAQSGRKVNIASVIAGVHSHDGGHSWSGGHR